MTEQSTTPPRGKTNILVLWLIPILMFGFGYLMVPLYEVFCDVTGLNGKTGRISASTAIAAEVDEERRIEVYFTASLNDEAPLDFKPTVTKMVVQPGKIYETSYLAVNKLAQPLSTQANPSVAPRQASTYFNKIECFCFSNQAFNANESKDMPVVFFIDPEIPEGIESVTLSYTLFKLKQTNASEKT